MEGVESMPLEATLHVRVNTADLDRLRTDVTALNAWREQLRGTVPAEFWDTLDNLSLLKFSTATPAEREAAALAEVDRLKRMRPPVTVGIFPMTGEGNSFRRVCVHLVVTWEDGEEYEGIELLGYDLVAGETDAEIIAGVSEQFERLGFQVIEFTPEEGAG